MLIYKPPSGREGGREGGQPSSEVWMCVPADHLQQTCVPDGNGVKTTLDDGPLPRRVAFAGREAS